jgi:transcriptional regulator with XRE-family HTH domain
MLVESVNSIPRCIGKSAASKVLPMGKKDRKPLETWQKQDAARLEELWELKKPMSQERFAEAYGIGTQGMFYQYVHGVVPLNYDAAAKFAKGLSVNIDDISPTLASELRDVVCPYLKPHHNGHRQHEALKLYSQYEALDEDMRDVISKLLLKSGKTRGTS